MKNCLQLWSVYFLQSNLCDVSYSKKDIPAANFTIHEVHCSRFLAECQYCKEYIPKSEMKNHLASEHVEVRNALLL